MRLLFSPVIAIRLTYLLTVCGTRTRVCFVYVPRQPLHFSEEGRKENTRYSFKILTNKSTIPYFFSTNRPVYRAVHDNQDSGKAAWTPLAACVWIWWWARYNWQVIAAMVTTWTGHHIDVIATRQIAYTRYADVVTLPAECLSDRWLVKFLDSKWHKAHLRRCHC